MAIATANATAAQADPVAWYTNIDNDVVFQTDRWYTSGVRIYRSAPLQDPGTRLDIGIGQEIYTGNTNCPECQPVDRPYGARLFSSFAYQVPRPDALTTLEADLGVLGPAALGRQTQKLIHHFVTAPHDDWSHQLDGRLDAQLVAVRSQRVLGADDWPVALVAHGGVVAGTVQSFVHAGGELRWGRATSALASSMRFAATPASTQPGTADGWSAFVGFGARSVFSNKLLTNNADDPAAPPTRNRTVRRTALGLGWGGEWVAMGFAWITESREFQEQQHTQRFGTLTLQLNFQ
jgi:lipid A 3-O-deacylase